VELHFTVGRAEGLCGLGAQGKRAKSTNV